MPSIDSIEYWRSGPNGGLADGDYSLVATVPDVAPRSFDDLFVVPGALYAYKARRYSTEYAAYSDFCAPVFAVAPYPGGVQPVATTATGVQSKFAIGIEGVYGQPVKAQKGILRKSGSPEMDLENPEHQALRGIDGDTEDVPGKATTGGQTKITATGEGISRPLVAFLGFPTTVATVGPIVDPATAATAVPAGGGATGGSLAAGNYFAKYTITTGPGQESLPSPESAAIVVAAGNIPRITFPAAPAAGQAYNLYLTPVGGAAGSEILYASNIQTATFDCSFLGNTPAPVPPAANTLQASFNDHTYKNSFVMQSATVVEVKGPSVIAYPGALVDELAFSFDKDQQTPAEFDLTWNLLNKLLYTQQSDLALDTAAFDTLPAFGPSQITVTLANILSSSIKTVAGNLKRNLQPRDVLNGFRGPQSHFGTMSTGTGTFDMFFDSLVDTFRYWGQVDTQTVPTGATKKRRTVPLMIQIVGNVNASGFRNQISIVFPRIAYKKLSDPIDGPGAVMQRVEWKAYFDSATNCLFYIIVRNSETNAQIIAPGTPLLTVPANDVQPLTY